jgi:aminoglycoside phosphotransferase (APT) family kinase protein
MGHNLQDAEFDRRILAIVQDLFGKTPRLRKCYSMVNYCAVISFDDNTADRVIKLTRHNSEDIEVEQRLYPLMRAHGLPVPEIEFTHLDYNLPSEPFIIMPKFSDWALADLRDKHQDDKHKQAALQACYASGQFIKDLPGKFGAVFKSLRATQLGALFDAVQRHTDQEPDLALVHNKEPELARTIDQRLATFARPQTRLLTHGQPHTKNILADDKGKICLVDFGTICLSSPLRDLCILLNSHDGWSSGKGDPAQRAAIVEGYGGLDTDEIQELHYWEFLYWVKDLRLYLSRAHRPGNTPFDHKQLATIMNRVQTVTQDKGIVHLL